MTAPLVTIGLEVHVQLNTKSKLFSSSSTEFGHQPNKMTSEIDVGLPGTLPVLNKEAVIKAIMFALSIDAKLNKKSVFARKNYFYPDLPKSYQITQEAYPIISEGMLKIDDKDIRIERAHLEEDAGKSIHDGHSDYTLIDLNRAGQPLLEIVSKPDISSAQEAIKYLKKLHHLVRYIDISNGNMQEGSFRCDANISIRMSSDEPLGTRVEIKNLNSFKFIEKAIDYEISRQHLALMNNEKIIQETRLFQESSGKTLSMRSKENAADYRYFPEPDLPPLVITDDLIQQAKDKLPTLPEKRMQELVTAYHLSLDEAEMVISSRAIAHFFSECANSTTTQSYKTIYNLIFGELSALLNKHQKTISTQTVKSEHIALIADYLSEKKISQPMAKEIINALWKTNDGSVDQIIKEKGLCLVHDDAKLTQLIEKVVHSFPEQVQQYKDGKTKLFSFFIGQIMKETKGNADPGILSKLLSKHLKESL